MKCFSIEPLTNWYCSCVHCAPDERKKKQKTHFFESPTNFFLSLWENPCIIPIRGIKWRLKQMSCLAICIVWSYCVCADACTQSIHSFESYYFFLFFRCEIVVEFSLWAFPIFFSLKTFIALFELEQKWHTTIQTESMKLPWTWSELIWKRKIRSAIKYKPNECSKLHKSNANSK